jgi:hypothetical protein
MNKKQSILLLLILFGLYAFAIPKKRNGRVEVGPLDKGEFLPDNYNVLDYQD